MGKGQQCQSCSTFVMGSTKKLKNCPKCDAEWTPKKKAKQQQQGPIWAAFLLGSTFVCLFVTLVICVSHIFPGQLHEDEYFSNAHVFRSGDQVGHLRLVSLNKIYRAVLQASEGDLILYAGFHTIWATWGSPWSWLELNEDGHICLYGNGKEELYCFDKMGQGLMLSNDGKLEPFKVDAPAKEPPPTTAGAPPTKPLTEPANKTAGVTPTFAIAESVPAKAAASDAAVAPLEEPPRGSCLDVDNIGEFTDFYIRLPLADGKELRASYEGQRIEIWPIDGGSVYYSRPFIGLKMQGNYMHFGTTQINYLGTPTGKLCLRPPQHLEVQNAKGEIVYVIGPRDA